VGNSAARAALILIGFTAACAQIVLMRELMVIFCGNEISIGLVLGTWLFWTAVGSFASPGGEAVRVMAILEGLLAVALPATVLAVRAGRAAMQPVPGEILGPGSMLLISFLALSLCCALCGALFPAASRLFGEQAAGTAYLWEAVGSAAGGLVAGLVLIRFLDPVEAAWGLGLLNALAACLLAARLRGRGRFLLAAAPAILAGCVLTGGLARWDAASLQRLWPGFHLVATRNSVYGNLAVVESEGGRSLYENGLRLFTVPDPEAAEEAVHYALLEHPWPRSALLIGGGVNGSATEALRHPGMKRLDYVELDPAILDMAREFFPAEWAALRADARVHLHVTDGRLFVKTTPRRFDAILVNLPDPQTAQLNRFFTAEFFREAAAKLTDTGLLSFSLAGSENYIPANLAELLRSMNRTARSVFPEVTAMPGETVHFFAAKRPGVLAAGPDELLARLRARHLKTRYVREYFIPFRMAPDRMRDLESQIQPLADTPVNRDARPVAYYFDVALWSSQFHQGYRAAFSALAKAGFGTVAGIVGALALFAMAGCRLLPGEERRLRASAGFCTVSMGFAAIGLEILLLLGFQAAYGYVYTQLALLIAAFMAGVASGSFFGLRAGIAAGTDYSVPRRAPALRTNTLPFCAAWTERSVHAPCAPPIERSVPASPAAAPFCAAPAGPSVRPLAVPALLAAVQAITALVCIGAGMAMASWALFPVLAFVAGSLGGFEFPLAARLFTASRPRGAGTLYALDLAGSCLGALLFSIYLVPVFGFLRTGLLMALVSLVAGLTALLSSLEGRPSSSYLRRPAR
jgi:spermidine synthase